LLILLPPSEGKAAPARRGRPVDIDALWSPELAGARRKVVDALVETSTGADASAVLGLTEGTRSELDNNRRLSELPARPAAEVYTGVLYDALGLNGLSAQARRRAGATILVQSALWGPIRITDRIPPYRLSIGTSLPGIGPLSAFWRRECADLRAPDELIIDCRSSGYASAWRPQSDKSIKDALIKDALIKDKLVKDKLIKDKLIKIVALTEKDGKRSVVSHFAKHTRGVVARLLLEADRLPRTPKQVRDVIARHGHCELDRTRTGWQLSVITDAAGRLRPGDDHPEVTA
jgi:cytoplasmic iron level regulating protein YaaA (DUF328/UPF0246 family)